MTRRALFALPLVALDLVGTRRQRHDDHRCASLGRRYERRGLTDQERAKLISEHCRKVGGEWVSSKVYQA